MPLFVCCRTYRFVLAPVDWERGVVFARDFVVTINGRQETMDLDVHYWGWSLGEPTNYHLLCNVLQYILMKHVKYCL